MLVRLANSALCAAEADRLEARWTIAYQEQIVEQENLVETATGEAKIQAQRQLTSTLRCSELESVLQSMESLLVVMLVVLLQTMCQSKALLVGCWRILDPYASLVLFLLFFSPRFRLHTSCHSHIYHIQANGCSL